MKVLFVVPSFTVVAGISNHYMGLEDYWTCNYKYCTQGRRLGKPAILYAIPDFILYIYYLITFKPQVVVVNPSLNWYMWMRDGLYILVASMFGKKTVTFFHGWRIPYANILIQSKIRKRIFNWIYARNSFIYVLCSEFKKQLQEIGYKGNIKLTTTKVDDKLVKDLNIEKRNRPIQNLLFLARVTRDKGIYIAIDAFRKVKERYPSLTFTVVGSGEALESAKKYVKDLGLEVDFKSVLIGKELAKAYDKGDIYILPTYAEGMATSVLEALTFGLPVLTAPIGGVVDFWEQEKIGFLIEEHSGDAYAEKIMWFLQHQDNYYHIAKYCHEFGVKYFLASKVAKQIEKDIQTIL